VITLGIDLASQPRNTASCAIAWQETRAQVTSLCLDVDDAALVAAMRGAAKVAIDAPLGWPVDFVAGLRDPGAWPVPLGESRSRLERRATDRWVHEHASKQPLSVSTDRIAYAAMRAAGLLAHIGASEPIDRSGMTGRVCEAYPDPAIRCFGLWPEGAGARESYKGSATQLRERIVERLPAWLDISAARRRACIDADHCLDALICALVARAAARALTYPPPDELRREAEAEGWIHLPRPGSLARLLD
jgi:predicted nuclease with RNAse H fold